MVSPSLFSQYLTISIHASQPEYVFRTLKAKDSSFISTHNTVQSFVQFD